MVCPAFICTDGRLRANSETFLRTAASALVRVDCTGRDAARPAQVLLQEGGVVKFAKHIFAKKLVFQPAAVLTSHQNLIQPFTGARRGIKVAGGKPARQ